MKKEIINYHLSINLRKEIEFLWLFRDKESKLNFIFFVMSKKILSAKPWQIMSSESSCDLNSFIMFIKYNSYQQFGNLIKTYKYKYIKDWYNENHGYNF